MFSRRPALSAPAPRLSLGGADWQAALANPYLGAGGAAALMLAAAGCLILVAGDPRAGAPSIRIPLDAPSRTAVATLRGALPLGAVTLDNLGPGQDIAMPGEQISGEAVITLPQGATVGDAPASDAASPAPAQVQGPPLTPAPIAGLSAPGPGGPLPVIGKDGRTPFQAYARPFHDDGKPRVALVIGGLGLNAAATRAAIERLPPEVTLSFVPYADGLQGWIDQARAAGHEVMLEVPMEPLDYPSNDPGPYTLMAGAAPAETVKRLDWVLSRAAGYFGLTNYLGGRFVNSAPAMAGFIAALKARGLAFVDDGSAAHKGAGIPRASASAVIDEELSADQISKQLAGLEAEAHQHGSALGSGFSYPVTIEQVAHWAQGLAARGYQLAPASALARR